MNIKFYLNGKASEYLNKPFYYENTSMLEMHKIYLIAKIALNLQNMQEVANVVKSFKVYLNTFLVFK